MEELKFKVSSALKDIIGRDLITDDNIAVFELVKNAYDAYATRVDITFENIYSDNSKIIIKDNGKGMSLQDIKDKWLFVAYSAKKEGTEDESFDYRDSIYQKRAFAGAKGIGRFSCDRLGKKLLLESTKKKKKAKTEIIETDWTRFEEDLKDEFAQIKIDHDTIGKSNYGLQHGTVLEISSLRSEWDRDKLLKLKRSLAKLINPNKDKSTKDFKIFLEVPEEIDTDKTKDDYKDIVNGEVQNLIFDTIELKTTVIEAKVSQSGDNVITQLKDGGTLIYKIKEKNTYPHLKSTNIVLYYLNQSAKNTFTRRMGINSIDYGHVFVYKNGFRIYPYGERGEDPFKLDNRKAQGYGRYLGTRELLGQININTNDINLKESSSRGDGFIKNNVYDQLDSFFKETLKRLEKYVVDVQKWGLGIDDISGTEDLNFKDRVIELLGGLTGSKELVDFEHGDQFLKLIKDAQSGSTERILLNLEKLAISEKDDSLLKDVKKVQSELNEIRAAKSDTEKSLKESERKRLEVSGELEEKVTENLFFKATRSKDLDNILNLMHHVRVSSSSVEQYISGLKFDINSGEKLNANELKNALDMISNEIKKINSISKYATQANFKVEAQPKKLNIIEFITGYILNVAIPFSKKITNGKINRTNVKEYYLKFRPLELTILLDNLVDNSSKALSNEIKIDFEIQNNKLRIHYADNGKGIPLNIKEKIFEYGFTTTDGSGMGLYHIKEIVSEMGGTIYTKTEPNNGAHFVLEFEN